VLPHYTGPPIIMNTKMLPSYALHLAYLAGLHILELDGPPLEHFNLDEVNAAENLLFAWYRMTKGIRKTEPAHDAHITIGEAHVTMINIRWRLLGYQSKPLKPKRREALEKAVKVLPDMAAWTNREFEQL
jgi:hypothetical protein